MVSQAESTVVHNNIRLPPPVQVPAPAEEPRPGPGEPEEAVVRGVALPLPGPADQRGQPQARPGVEGASQGDQGTCESSFVRVMVWPIEVLRFLWDVPFSFLPPQRVSSAAALRSRHGRASTAPWSPTTASWTRRSWPRTSWRSRSRRSGLGA